MIARRTVCLSGGVGMLTACIRSHAQSLQTVRRFGLIFLSTELGWAPYREAFVQSMHELGWEEGKSIRYRSVYANGDVTRLKALTRDLIKQQVDAIVDSDSPTTRAAQEATSTVPIVFVALSTSQAWQGRAARIDLLEGPGTLLGTDAAVHLIGLLQERSPTVVTFAPDEALAAHHDLHLVLQASGMWSAQPIHIERPVT